MSDTPPLQGRALSSNPDFILCDYFDEKGRRVDRFYVTIEEGDDAADKVSQVVRDRGLEPVLDAMMADAMASVGETRLEDAALALNVLLHEVADDRMSLAAARDIASIGVNFRKAVTIAEIVPALEKEFGGASVSWARGIFSHLDLGPPYLH